MIFSRLLARATVPSQSSLLPIAIFWLAFMLSCNSAYAGYRVSPLVLHMTPGSQSAGEEVRVFNKQDTPLAIEISVSKRLVSADGSETQTAADADFVVLPPQALVPAGKTQVFRVQYAGPVIETGQGYYFTVSQLKIAAPGEKPNGVQLLLNFAVPLYVNPSNAEVQLNVRGMSAKKPDQLVLQLENTGSKAFSLTNGRWELKAADGSQIPVDPKTAFSTKQSSLMPGRSQRAFVITLPSAAGSRSAASASYTPRVD